MPETYISSRERKPRFSSKISYLRAQLCCKDIFGQVRAVSHAKYSPSLLVDHFVGGATELEICIQQARYTENSVDCR